VLNYAACNCEILFDEEFNGKYIVTRYTWEVTKSDYETLAAFRYALRRFLNFSERVAQDRGLPVRQYLALLAIEGFPGRDFVSMGELAERLQIAPHSAVGLVNRLEAADLVRREPAPEDRRRVVVRLTCRGRARLEKLASAHHEELRTVGPVLSGLLAKVAASAEGGRSHPPAEPAACEMS
jgi:DNA-binding MarR family transcriptional regulator